MSEEEIVQCCQNLIVTLPIKHINSDAIQGLLDLYKQEKLNTLNLSEQLNKERKKNDILQTNYEILQGEMDRIGIDTLGLEKGNSTDDVIEEIKLLLKEKESNREAIQYCKKDLAFKKRLEKAKDTIDNYNAGRFDTSESILNILEE